MSRHAKSALALIFVVVALAAAACSNATGPTAPSMTTQSCDWNSSNTCK